MKARRCTSQAELDDVIEYWLSMPRGYGYHVEASLIQFLQVFTPSQIKGAMYIATAKGHGNYFKYLCGVLHNWRKELESDREPSFFKVG